MQYSFDFAPTIFLSRVRLLMAKIAIAFCVGMVLTAVLTVSSAAAAVKDSTNEAPSAETHYVVQPGDTLSSKAGDTLSSIAQWYGINLYTLASVNGISNISRIYVGQRLYIP